MSKFGGGGPPQCCWPPPKPECCWRRADRLAETALPGTDEDGEFEEWCAQACDLEAQIMPMHVHTASGFYAKCEALGKDWVNLDRATVFQLGRTPPAARSSSP